MDVDASAPKHGDLSPLGTTPEALKYVSRRDRKYLIERHHIRAKLENPGGSVVLTVSALVDAERPEEYSSQVGSEAHLDLIAAEDRLDKLVCDGTITKAQRQELYDWFDELDSLAASKWVDMNLIDERQRTRKRPKLNSVRAVIDHYESPSEKAWIHELEELIAGRYHRPENRRRRV